MQNYSVNLESQVSKSFRCVMAANSLDIDVEKKSKHHFSVNADLLKDWNVGLIVGASGSGKTTLAKQIFGANCFDFFIDESLPVIDQFPENWTYEMCQDALNGIGLSQVPCWIRPVFTLSNGQKARAIAALQLAKSNDFIVDEWTSVVDRTVAKSMSHCLQKHARKNNKKIVAVACHYDILEWLNPCWVIDCNKSEYIDRRLLWRNFERAEKLDFEIREIGRESWKYFSKYHYLSDLLPGGEIKLFGLFHGNNQIGFQCFANYVPTRANEVRKMHSNRTVIHPDYTGLGLGIKLIEETSKIIKDQGYDVWAKFSSAPVARAFEKSENWKLTNVQRFQAKPSGNMLRGGRGIRQAVKTYSYHYEPK